MRRTLMVHAMAGKQIDIEALEVRERALCALIEGIEALPKGSRLNGIVEARLVDGVRSALGDPHIPATFVRKRIDELLMFYFVDNGADGLVVTANGREALQKLSAKHSIVRPRA